MASHPTKLQGYDSLKEAASAVENLRYDALADFLIFLKNALEARAWKDRQAGRTQLAHHLERTSHHLLLACSEMHMAWGICKRFMK